MGSNKTKYNPKPSPKRALPVWLIVGGIAVLLVAIAFALGGGKREKAAIEVTGQPKIKIEQDVYNYGEVKLGGTPIRTTIKVTNVGDQALQFTEAPYIEVLEGC